MIKKISFLLFSLMFVSAFADEPMTLEAEVKEQVLDQQNLSVDEWFDLFHQQNTKDQAILFSEMRNYYFLVCCLAENPTVYRKIIGNMTAKKYLYSDLTEEERNKYAQLEALRRYLSEMQNRDFDSSFEPSEDMNLLLKNFLLLSGYMKMEQDADGRNKLFNVFYATDEECMHNKILVRTIVI